MSTESNQTELKLKIEAIEQEMALPDFWSNKERAQGLVNEHKDLKAELAGLGKYDKGNAMVTIFSGAGGADAEDFTRMLVEMYRKFVENKNLTFLIKHKNENDIGGFRNITFEIEGKGAYGIIKNESGVHRLVRISPFNAKSQRHTSFSLVEVIPKFTKTKNLDIPEDQLKIEFSKSSGPGGQNVNKRETAVRIVHLPTGLSVHSDSERTQGGNRDQAMKILEAKLFRHFEEERDKKQKSMYISKTTDIEWGNQIRSYVLHPYKMVKDHRTKVETNDIEGVLDGKIEEFIEAELKL